MNERVLDGILATLDAPLPGDQAGTLRAACRHLGDRGVMLTGHALRGGQLRLVFRDAERVAEFGADEARALLSAAAAGAADPWQDLATQEGAVAPGRPEDP
jgi:hypothetical protein